MCCLLTTARAIINGRPLIEHSQAAASPPVTLRGVVLLLDMAELMKFWAIAHSKTKQQQGNR